MVQHWASDGEFYICGFVLCNFIEPVAFMHCALTLLYYVNKPVMFSRYTCEIGRMDIR